MIIWKICIVWLILIVWFIIIVFLWFSITIFRFFIITIRIFVLSITIILLIPFLFWAIAAVVLVLRVHQSVPEYFLRTLPWT